MSKGDEQKNMGHHQPYQRNITKLNRILLAKSCNDLSIMDQRRKHEIPPSFFELSPR